jgi:hypothetical protein
VQAGRTSGFPAAWIALAAALLPLVAIHVGWGLSVASGAIEGGFPYLDGSTSISRACRKEPAVHLFRALVLPSAALVAATWWVCAAWLAHEGLAGRRGRAWVLALGLVAAVFLVLYATFLGTDGEVYRWMRRFGVLVFFGGTAVAELVVTIALVRARPAALEPWVARAMRALCAGMLVAGPVNVVAGRLFERETVANLLEWWFTLGMVGYPLLLARVWARAGLALRLADPSA